MELRRGIRRWSVRGVLVFAGALLVVAALSGRWWVYRNARNSCFGVSRGRLEVMWNPNPWDRSAPWSTWIAHEPAGAERWSYRWWYGRPVMPARMEEWSYMAVPLWMISGFLVIASAARRLSRVTRAARKKSVVP